MDDKLKEMKESLDRNSEVMTDLTIRVTALEQALINNSVLGEEQLTTEVKSIVDKITKMIPAMAEQLQKEELNKQAGE